MSIFVIDDHPLMREAVVMLLRRLRASTQVVELERLASVSKAITEHGEPELVCLDLKLPDTNGVSGVSAQCNRNWYRPGATVRFTQNSGAWTP